MSFFAVKVKSGQEIEAKEMLKSVFAAIHDTRIKAIYALETFTHLLKDDNLHEEKSGNLDDKDITDYLQTKRIKDTLSTLRAAHAEIPSDSGREMEKLRHSYQEEIDQQSKNLKDMQLSKRIYTVMKGYILLELKEDLVELPGDMWQMVKTVPKVCRVLSPYSVPEEEVESFFETVDLTPSVEINFIQDKVNLPEVEETATVQDQYGNEKKCVEPELPQNDIQEKDTKIADEELPVQRWLEACYLFLRKKKKTIWIPLPLYRHLQKNRILTFRFLNEKISLFFCIPTSIRLELSG